MSIHLWILGFLLASTSWLGAQLSVEIVTEQEQFLRDETVPVKIRLTNRSGQTLELGREPDWLTVAVESREGFVVQKISEVHVPGEFSLESASVMSRVVDLAPFYDLSRPGRYVARATLRVKSWNEEFTSPPKNFEIIKGVKIWEQEVGVPAPAGAPEVRKYALQHAQYLKQMRLYVRVTDLAERRVFRVFPIGPLVAFSRPEAQVDKLSHLHVIFQTGARSFSYNVINPDGELVTRQTHDYTQNRPVLKAASDGRIVVSGGVRRMTDGDLPRSSVSTNDVSLPQP